MSNAEHESILRNAERERDASVSLSGFDLRKVLMSCPRLNGFDLSKTDLRASKLSGAHLQAANLSHANLAKAQLGCSDVRNANLQSADCSGTDLNGSVLVGADLSHANLTKANLVKTRLNDVTFIGTNLDRADLRGAQGLTAEQLSSAINTDTAIFDERLLKLLGRTGNVTVARHGTSKPAKRRRAPQVDLFFHETKPYFGDVFQLCGYNHPEFPPSGDYGFAELEDLGVQQLDDYFAICSKGDPVVWLFPLIKGQVVHHHPGPFDALRLELADLTGRSTWSKCIARMATTLKIPVIQETRGEG